MAPMTPRRSTLTGATAINLLTPRSANRGSIFGGALRTQTRAKPDLIVTATSRLTISGVLPARPAATIVPPSPSMHTAAQRVREHVYPEPSSSLASSIRTPLKPSRSALSLHAGFMTPNRV
jgi:hypothetical protein